jgi:DNA-binding response OmpR family regulator
MRAILRRSGKRIKGIKEIFSHGNLEVNFSRYTVSVGGKEVHLGANEYKLLFILVRNEGRIVASLRLINDVWRGESTISNLVSHMSNLRRKMRGFSGEIKSVSGVGYMFCKGDSSDTEQADER